MVTYSELILAIELKYMAHNIFRHYASMGYEYIDDLHYTPKTFGKETFC